MHAAIIHRLREPSDPRGSSTRPCPRHGLVPRARGPHSDSAKYAQAVERNASSRVPSVPTRPGQPWPTPVTGTSGRPANVSRTSVRVPLEEPPQHRTTWRHGVLPRRQRWWLVFQPTLPSWRPHRRAEHAGPTRPRNACCGNLLCLRPRSASPNSVRPLPRASIPYSHDRRPRLGTPVPRFPRARSRERSR